MSSVYLWPLTLIVEINKLCNDDVSDDPNLRRTVV